MHRRGGLLYDGPFTFAFFAFICPLFSVFGVALSCLFGERGGDKIPKRVFGALFFLTYCFCVGGLEILI